MAWRTVGAILARVAADIDRRVDRLAGLRRIGIDEISYKRGYYYLTVVVDHDSGRLVWAGDGRQDATIARFFDELGAHRSRELTHVTADMAPAIARVVKARAPKAIRCADPFHVVAWGTEALDIERRRAWNNAAGRRHTNEVGRPKLAVGEARAIKRSRYAHPTDGMARGRCVPRPHVAALRDRRVSVGDDRRHVHPSAEAHRSAGRPDGGPPALGWIAVAVLWAALQVAVPLRHLAYAGDVRWTEEGYYGSFRVMLTEKAALLQFAVTDPATGQRWTVDPTSVLTDCQARQAAARPDLTLAAAHLVDDFAGRGHPGVEVRADSWVSFNGRRRRRMIDPTVDLPRSAGGPGPRTTSWPSTARA